MTCKFVAPGFYFEVEYAWVTCALIRLVNKCGLTLMVVKGMGKTIKLIIYSIRLT